MSGNRLWQQYREVQAGDIRARASGNEDDLDIEVSVGFSGNDKTLGFEVTLWNLSSSTWSGVMEGDTCQIDLGWMEGGPTPESVCLGIINTKKTNTDGQDREYILKGKDESSAAFNSAFSDTWQNQPPDAIAREIAGEVGLSIGQVDSVGQPIEGYWSIKKDQDVNNWLKELVNEAAKKTGTKWEYYARGGQFYFVEKESSTETAININQGNAIKADRASGNTEKTSGSEEIDFEAYLDPRLEKDSILNVDTADVSGTYKVSSYDFTSSTVDGSHFMSGTAAPVDAQYRQVFPGMPRGFARVGRELQG